MFSSLANFLTEASGVSTWAGAICGSALSVLFGFDGMLISSAFVTGLQLIVEAYACIRPEDDRYKVLLSFCWLCTLSNSVLCKQHHAEPCFSLHHARIGVRSLFKGSCLDHRANILEDTEGKRVLLIHRRSGQRSENRAPSEDEWERIQLDRVLRHTNHDEFAAHCKSGHEWAHCIAASGCCENRSGPAHTLRYRCGIVSRSIDVDVHPKS